MTPAIRHAIIIAALVLAPAAAQAQSSALYTQAPPDPPPTSDQRRSHDDPENSNAPPLSTSLRAVSLIAVCKPPTHAFAIHDLVTIIIREDTEVKSSADMNTDKQNNVTGQLNMPRFSLLQSFMKAFGGPNPTTDPTLAANFENKYQANGTADQSDTFTSQITARIIDVKPNGTLVLEARKYIQSNRETLNMILTGTCRKQDVASDNTIVSTQIYDLHLEKQHSGDLHSGTQKGLLAKFFEYLFNF